MSLTDYETIFNSVKNMPIADKHNKILEIKNTGFKYQGKEIIEIVKDKWVFLQKGSETDIQNIDFVVCDWLEKEEKRIEREEAKNGNSVIDKYFKKYGVMSKKEKPKDGSLYNQTVYFDGKSTPNDFIGWNADLFMYRLGVYNSSNSYGSYPSCVKFYADKKIEDLMEAKIKNDEPNLRHCHDWYTNPHKKSENHYKYENWIQDIETAKTIFIDEVKKLIGEHKIFQYNSKKELYCIPEKCVFWFEGEADHNGDETVFYKSDIYSKNKYRTSSFRSNTMKLPTKFDKTATSEEIIEMAMKYCEDKFSKHNFRQEFKY